jgi:hypothetical protein
LHFGTPDVAEAAHTRGADGVGYLVSPLIITSQQTIKVQQRVVTASTTNQIIFHGFVAEIQGKTIEA